MQVKGHITDKERLKLCKTAEITENDYKTLLISDRQNFGFKFVLRPNMGEINKEQRKSYYTSHVL
jgi:hypothetical protein